jgi:thioredoxin-related protein
MKLQPNQAVFHFLLLILLGISSPMFSQPAVDTAVRWQTISEVQQLMVKAPRPIMAFFYMPGDDSSRIMLQNTINRREIISYVNSRFYAVKIDATSNDSIKWFDHKTYTRKESNPVNDLIPHLFRGKPVFPSLILYTTETEGFTFNGFKNRYEMRCILVYVAEEINKTTRFDLWLKAYKNTYPTFGPAQPLKSPIQWHSLKEALELQKKKPKGLFINWYARLNVGSLVMLHNAYEDPTVAKYLNEHFYCVSLDVHSKDTLYWDKPYYNEPDKGKFNQLALEQLQDNMKFPSLLFFDKERKLIAMQQSYLEPVNLFAFANYAGSGSYRTMTFQSFIKTFKPGINFK